MLDATQQRSFLACMFDAKESAGGLGVGMAVLDPTWMRSTRDLPTNFKD